MIGEDFAQQSEGIRESAVIISYNLWRAMLQSLIYISLRRNKNLGKTH